MGVPPRELKERLTEREAAEYGEDTWDVFARLEHLLTVAATCGNILCAGFAGTMPYGAKEICPWSDDQPRGELDPTERAAAGVFFGGGVYDLGPMGDPESAWADD